jgi:hypothetical protein
MGNKYSQYSKASSIKELAMLLLAENLANASDQVYYDALGVYSAIDCNDSVAQRKAEDIIALALDFLTTEE